MNEVYIFSNKKDKWIKASKWDLFWNTLKYKFTKWKIVNTSKYKIIPQEERKLYFKMSNKEYEESHKIYEEKGTISYEFYPCCGIGWGLKVHTKDETIDITDYDSW